MRAVAITFGGMARPVADQLRDQALQISLEDAERIDDYSLQLLRLLIAGVLTESEVHRARKRLVKLTGDMVVKQKARCEK